jgi:tetratricopeptide (TPR) repeat protein
MRGRTILAVCILTAMSLSPLPCFAAEDTLTTQAAAAEKSRDFEKALQMYRHLPGAELDEARICWMLNKRADARAALLRALEKNGRNAKALTLLAKVNLSEGNADDAMKHLQFSESIDPKNAETQRLLADLYAHAGMLPEAHEHYKKLLELQPDSVHARLNVVAYLASSGKVDEAIKVCRAGMQAKGSHNKLRIELAHLLLQTGRINEANEAFRVGRDPESSDSEPYQMLAITCGARNDWVSAFSYAQSFNDIDVDSVNAMVPAAWAAYVSGDLLEAKTRLEKAVEVCPDNADLRNVYAIVLMDLRRFPNAATQLLDAAKLDPNNINVKLNTAILQLLSGKMAEGLEEAESILKEHPNVAAAASLCSYANLLNNKPAEAAKMAETALRLDSTDTLAHVVCARVLRDDGAFDIALSHLEDAKRAAGGASVFIQCEIADTLLAKGDAAGATKAAQFALQLSSTSLDAKRSLARALAKQGNWAGALLYLRELSARNPKDLDAKLELGNALVNNADYVAAQLVYESAQKMAPQSGNVLRAMSVLAEKQGNKRLARKYEKLAATTRSARD